MLPRREASSHKTICRRKSKYCSPLHFTIKTDFNASATGAITCIEILRICQANRGFFRLTGSSSEVQQKTQGSSCEQCKQIGSSKLRSLLRFKDTNTKKQRWNQFVLTCWISHWSLDDNGTKKNSKRVKIRLFFPSFDTSIWLLCYFSMTKQFTHLQIDMVGSAPSKGIDFYSSFHPLPPLIGMLILPCTCYTFPRWLVGRIWCYFKWQLLPNRSEYSHYLFAG